MDYTLKENQTNIITFVHFKAMGKVFSAFKFATGHYYQQLISNF